MQDFDRLGRRVFRFALLGAAIMLGWSTLPQQTQLSFINYFGLWRDPFVGTYAAPDPRCQLMIKPPPGVVSTLEPKC